MEGTVANVVLVNKRIFYDIVKYGTGEDAETANWVVLLRWV